MRSYRSCRSKYQLLESEKTRTASMGEASVPKLCTSSLGMAVSKSPTGIFWHGSHAKPKVEEEAMQSTQLLLSKVTKRHKKESTKQSVEFG